MERDYFWLNDAQLAKVAPHLPTGTRGKARVDDRRVISGIVHVLKSGGLMWMRRTSTARAKPSTTASSAGPLRVSGPSSSRRLPRRAAHLLTC